jgi:AraC-like DNA-binding protein
MSSGIERDAASATRASHDKTMKPVVVVIGRLPQGIASAVASTATVIQCEAPGSWQEYAARASLEGHQFRLEKAQAPQVDGAIQHERLQAAAIVTCIDILTSLAPAAQPAAEVTILHAADRPNVGMVARWLNLSERSLQRTFAEQYLPPPSGLIRFARWLVFARTADRIDTPLRTLARLAGFTSIASFRKGLARELGLRPSDLRGIPDFYADLRNELVKSYGDESRNGPAKSRFGANRTSTVPPIVPPPRRRDVAARFTATQEDLCNLQQAKCGGGAGPTRVSCSRHSS